MAFQPFAIQDNPQENFVDFINLSMMVSRSLKIFFNESTKYTDNDSFHEELILVINRLDALGQDQRTNDEIEAGARSAFYWIGTNLPTLWV